MKLSIIIPCYNELDNILPMHTRVTTVLKKLSYEYEIIFVDNGSTDDSRSLFEKIAKKDPRVIVIVLSRNFYKSQGAYTAGIDYATGEAIILIDGDLQDPPELIPQFVKQWKKGFHIVYGKRVKRTESTLRKIGYHYFYKLFRKLSYLDMPTDAGDFSLIDRRVADIMKQMPERNRYIRGLRAWVGFTSIGVPYEREERYYGRTTNSMIDNVRWALFAIMSFSYAPLELISWLAFVTVFLAGIGLIIYTVLYFIVPHAPRGFQTILMIVLFLGGIQLVCFSIIAQYLSIMFEEIKQRPKYIVDAIIGSIAKP